MSLFEMAGVLATYPLLLVASGQSIDTGALGEINRFLGAGSRQQLIIYLALIVVSAFLLKSLLTIAFRWWQLGFIQQLELNARTNLLGYYLDSPYILHKGRELPKIHTNLVTAVNQAFSQTVLGLLSLATSALTVVLMVLVIFFVSPIIALASLILFVGVGYLVPAILKKRFTDLSLQLNEADRVSWFASMPALQAFREMRLFGVADEFKKRYAKGALIRANANKRISIYNELPKHIIEITFVIGIALLATLLFTTQDQATAVATMGVFTIAAVRVMPAVTAGMASLNQVRAGSAGVSLLNQEIQVFQASEHFSKIPSSGHVFEGDIELKNLTFSYSPAEKPVLNNINLTIPAEKTVAFVGASGSGKSTIIDLVLGMMRADQGEVLCGGTPIFDDIRSWQTSLGVVPQSVYVLPGDLRRNVAFGLPDEEIDDERVLEALHHAELTELVETLPHGIREDLGQDGGRLSGGQRQRLGIARALYRKPSLLVLDEATSALDNKTEYKITQTIEELSGTMTILIVAHRLSTIKKADVICYMQGGEIVGQGNFSELTSMIPEFKELVELGKL
ncbi:MAG: ABC transporter ATP-binding protein [Rothia sp. (in: high G+C Gram-positive bacteria)]|nr:ABC transporter ATP-binding protein [Rothia sp. (in: high G+C Gram-positive bacteria)]